VIGVIGAGERGGFADLLVARRMGLKDFGFVEGQNFEFAYAFAAGRFDELPKLAGDLVRRPAALIISTGVGSGLAAKGATSTIPHVFLSQDDPVKVGFVASLNKPGGNSTGVSLLTAELAAKRVDVARQLMPKGAPLAYLMNSLVPKRRDTCKRLKQLHKASSRSLLSSRPAAPNRLMLLLRKSINGGRARSSSALTAISSAAVNRSSHLLRVTGSRQFTIGVRMRLRVASSAMAKTYRQIGVYAARILKGEKPADLPVVQSAKFELVINLRTAKALGIEFPAQVLALADEVIE
jgi:putative ABC transport system substrate-binding protein